MKRKNVKNSFDIPEKESPSNLTGFFALLYQVDLRNKQNSSNKNEDQKSRNPSDQAK